MNARRAVRSILRRAVRPLPVNAQIAIGCARGVLADRADEPLSSRLGLELAIRGQRPWVAGDVTYRRRGFTRDLESKEEMIARLETGWDDGELSGEERQRAKRFAYLCFFRCVTRLPWLRPADGVTALTTFRDRSLLTPAFAAWRWRSRRVRSRRRCGIGTSHKSYLDVFVFVYAASTIVAVVGRGRRGLQARELPT